VPLNFQLDLPRCATLLQHSSFDSSLRNAYGAESSDAVLMDRRMPKSISEHVRKDYFVIVHIALLDLVAVPAASKIPDEHLQPAVTQTTASSAGRLSGDNCNRFSVPADVASAAGSTLQLFVASSVVLKRHSVKPASDCDGRCHCRRCRRC
jgi:hypothetical protein